MYVIVDLDKTLCRVNTFRFWTISAFLLPNRVTGIRFPVAFFLFNWLYLLRLLGVLNHRALKLKFITYWNTLPSAEREVFNRRFSDFISQKMINRKVLSEVNKQKKELGSQLLLATAAPAFYAKYIAERFGMRCLASGFIEDEWRENVGITKNESVEREIGTTQFVLFTDHLDDWPLVEKAQNCILVNPSKQLLQKAIDVEIRFEVITSVLREKHRQV